MEREKVDKILNDADILADWPCDANGEANAGVEYLYHYNGKFYLGVSIKSEEPRDLSEVDVAEEQAEESYIWRIISDFLEYEE